jgi:hypothetical protein
MLAEAKKDLRLKVKFSLGINGFILIKVFGENKWKE